VDRPRHVKWIGGQRHWIDALFGMALAANMVLVPVSVVVPALGPVAGAATLVAAAVGLFRVRRLQRLLGLALLGAGVSAMLAAFVLGARPSLRELLTLNQTLVGLLTAVSFVRLITGDGVAHPARLTGVAAVWRTAVIVQLLGAVINVSAVTLVGDRLRRSGQLLMPDALLLSRAYSPGAFWSPFWGASAAALTYASGASSGALLLCGGLLALCAFVVSVALAIPGFGTRLAEYRGYPLSARVLVLPIALTALVIGFHLIVPKVQLAVVVLVASLVVPVLVLAVTRTRRLPRILVGHVVRGLAPMHGEAVLFTGAGVLSVGLRVLFETLGITVPVEHYTVWLAWASVLAMTLVSLVGVHPVISIAVIASMLGPAIVSEPTLFALAGTIAWGTAAAVGPISGLNVFLAGRFGVSGFDVARRNVPYLAVVVVFALPALALCAKLT
jgi:hypothetical protein